MPKAFCITGAVVAILLLLVFGIDLGVGFPFDRQSWLIDVCMVLSSGMLGYISWATFRTIQ
jgi:hypothetical protein